MVVVVVLEKKILLLVVVVVARMREFWLQCSKDETVKRLQDSSLDREMMLAGGGEH